MTDIDTDGFDEAAESLIELEERLEEDIPDYADDTADSLLDNIKRSVPVQSATDDTKDQPPLRETFYRGDGGAKSYYNVGSDAPYAHLIEQGTEGGWQIPVSEAGVAWVPENPSSWQSNPNVYYDNETGKVVLDYVTAGSYDGRHYVRQALWRTQSDFMQIGPVVQKAIVESGFKPSLK